MCWADKCREVAQKGLKKPTVSCPSPVTEHRTVVWSAAVITGTTGSAVLELATAICRGDARESASLVYVQGWEISSHAWIL